MFRGLQSISESCKMDRMKNSFLKLKTGKIDMVRSSAEWLPVRVSLRTAKLEIDFPDRFTKKQHRLGIKFHLPLAID